MDLALDKFCCAGFQPAMEGHTHRSCLPCLYSDLWTCWPQRRRSRKSLDTQCSGLHQQGSNLLWQLCNNNWILCFLQGMFWCHQHLNLCPYQILLHQLAQEYLKGHAKTEGIKEDVVETWAYRQEEVHHPILISLFNLMNFFLDTIAVKWVWLWCVCMC